VMLLLNTSHRMIASVAAKGSPAGLFGLQQRAADA
jgi:hypothetical protein